MEIDLISLSKLFYTRSVVTQVKSFYPSTGYPFWSSNELHNIYTWLLQSLVNDSITYSYIMEPYSDLYFKNLTHVMNYSNQEFMDARNDGNDVN